MEAADEVEEELEAVLAIILDGIDIIRKPNCIIINAQISPLTALDSEQCFVGYLLELSLEKKYPEVPPVIKVRTVLNKILGCLFTIIPPPCTPARPLTLI